MLGYIFVLLIFNARCSLDGVAFTINEGDLCAFRDDLFLFFKYGDCHCNDILSDFVFIGVEGSCFRFSTTCGISPLLSVEVYENGCNSKLSTELTLEFNRCERISMRNRNYCQILNTNFETWRRTEQFKREDGSRINWYDDSQCLGEEISTAIIRNTRLEEIQEVLDLGDEEFWGCYRSIYNTSLFIERYESLSILQVLELLELLGSLFYCLLSSVMSSIMIVSSLKVFSRNYQIQKVTMSRRMKNSFLFGVILFVLIILFLFPLMPIVLLVIICFKYCFVCAFGVKEIYQLFTYGIPETRIENIRKEEEEQGRLDPNYGQRIKKIHQKIRERQLDHIEKKKQERKNILSSSSNDWWNVRMIPTPSKSKGTSAKSKGTSTSSIGTSTIWNPTIDEF